MIRAPLFCGLALLMTNALADNPSVEQRLLSLELRVQQLEALMARSASTATPAPAAMPAPTPAPASNTGPGRFTEQDAARRSIEFRANGTFVLNSRGGPFTGAWEGQADGILVIRSASGLTETFRLENGNLVDSRGVRWARAGGR